MSAAARPGHPEDDLNHPDHEEGHEPGHYRRIASDPAACRAMAAEVLDWAFQSDAGLAEIRSIVPLATAWLKLAELAFKHGANSSDQC